MSANQEQIEARLAAYIDGELDVGERAKIEKHLAGNPQHKALIEELMIQRDLLHAVPREKAPPEIAETIQSQLERSVLLGQGEEAARGPLRIPMFAAAVWTVAAFAASVAPENLRLAARLLICGAGLILLPRIKSVTSPSPRVRIDVEAGEVSVK